MARNFLQEWNDDAVKPNTTPRPLDPEQDDMLLEMGYQLGIPMIRTPETPGEVLDSILGTKDTTMQGPAQEAPETPPEPIEDPATEVAKDDVRVQSTDWGPWPQLKQGIEVAPLPQIKPVAENPEFGELANSTEDNLGFIPIPDDFTPQEKTLINYHRDTLQNYRQLVDEQGTTTVYITGVRGPDGREYLIPGYFDGKRQDPEVAALRASLVGWNNYPAYASPEQADVAVQKIHKIIESDGMSLEHDNVGEPSQTQASTPTFKIERQEVAEEEMAQALDMGNNEPMHKRTIIGAPIPGKNPWQFSYPVGKLTRGLRNNNPGNVRKGKTNWMGQRQGDDPDFATFSSPELGIRAMARVIRTYRERHGLNNIVGVITRWAPKNENDTNSYIRSVSKAMGVDPSAPLDTKNPYVALALVKAIIYHENGAQPYSDNTIMTGIRMSGLLGSDY